MDQDTSRFVERMGFFFQEDGAPHIAGRLFGLLYLTAAPISLDELATTLNVSKASISINARLLAQRGLVERITRPGDRRDYYQVGADSFARTLAHHLARIRSFRDLLKEFETSTPLESPAIANRFSDFHAAYAQMLETIESALAMWRSRSRTTAGDTVEVVRRADG